VQRRSLLLLAPIVPLGMFVSRYLRASGFQPMQPADYREQAIRLSQLAANIHSVTDARSLVDFVVDLFPDELLPAAVSNSLREKVAQAEFGAVSDPQNLIPEWRVAEAWNTYAQTMQAPQESQVTAAEIHNLRDAFLTAADLGWKQGRRSIWSVPTIYATQNDGTIAIGCRAIECMRIFWDLGNIPTNLFNARVRVSQGVFASDLFRQDKVDSSQATHGSYVSGEPAPRNSILIAEREYVAKKGMKAFNKVLNAMLDQALS
jgi:hypothetical protein